jgi:hypothetical protein
MRSAARSQYRLSASYSADLKGTGDQARILVFSPFNLNTGKTGQPSDELLIYDVMNQRLRRRFRFRGVVSQLAPGGRHYQFTTRLELKDVADLDRNGSQEVVATLSYRSADGYYPRPLLIRWDPIADKYRVAPLLAPPRPHSGLPPDRVRPSLVTFAHPGVWARDIRQYYTQPATIVNQADHTVFSSYGTDEYVIRKSRFNSALIGAFTVKARYHADPHPLVQLKAWSIDLSHPTPVAAPCFSVYPRFDKPVLYRLHVTDRPWAALGRAWRRVAANFIC